MYIPVKDWTKRLQLFGCIAFELAAVYAAYHQYLVIPGVAPVQQYTVKVEQIPVRSEPDQIPVYMETADEIAAEMYCDSLEELAICVEAEAGNQGLTGKRMVAAVILNRVDSPDYPDTIQEVIEQPYHFASYWDGHMAAATPTEETYQAVQMELQYRCWPDLLYFTAEGYSSFGTPWGKVGDHYFCTE
ncbi:MAG: cell wall hydrolase [Lachnospiraceae bacterium]|nr:cell wall hydrolase [Lachnospiraceae bacterium]